MIWISSYAIWIRHAVHVNIIALSVLNGIFCNFGQIFKTLMYYYYDNYYYYYFSFMFVCFF